MCESDIDSAAASFGATASKLREPSTPRRGGCRAPSAEMTRWSEKRFDSGSWAMAFRKRPVFSA